MSMTDEYKFLRKSKLSVPNVAYLLSRWVVFCLRIRSIAYTTVRFGTAAYCIAGTIFQGHYATLLIFFKGAIDVQNSCASYPMPSVYCYVRLLFRNSDVRDFIIVFVPGASCLQQLKDHHILLQHLVASNISSMSYNPLWSRRRYVLFRLR